MSLHYEFLDDLAEIQYLHLFNGYSIQRLWDLYKTGEMIPVPLVRQAGVSKIKELIEKNMVTFYKFNCSTLKCECAECETTIPQMKYQKEN